MSSSADNKRIVIIAGPNGAGKTTFAREFLPTDAALPNFVNADLIAAGLSPFAPDLAAFKAGRIRNAVRFPDHPGRMAARGGERPRWAWAGKGVYSSYTLGRLLVSAWPQHFLA